MSEFMNFMGEELEMENNSHPYNVVEDLSLKKFVQIEDLNPGGYYNGVELLLRISVNAYGVAEPLGYVFIDPTMGTVGKTYAGYWIILNIDGHMAKFHIAQTSKEFRENLSINEDWSNLSQIFIK